MKALWLIMGAIGIFALPLALAENASLTIDTGFPQGNAYRFTCEPEGFNATGYEWSFDDGTEINTSGGTVLHTFTEEGEYNVTCLATGANLTGDASLLITVELDETPPEELGITIVSPIAHEYAGPAPFHFTTTLPANITYGLNGENASACENCTEFAQNRTLVDGNYSLIVFAEAGNQSANESVDFTVDTNVTGNETPGNETPSNGTASITIAEFYPQTGAYVFACETPGLDPERYNWFYGDGMKSLDIQNKDVFHTYLENGEYSVACEALDAQGNVAREASLNIAIDDIPRRNTCSVMQNSPATCEGGEITDQGFGDGTCRRIACLGESGGREILVCDKPSADNPLYFEMYEIDAASGLRICIAGTCIEPGSGFAQSGFLACTAGEFESPGNGTTRVTLCHDPSGRNPRTLTVDDNAVDAHLAHGDTRGACGTNETVTYEVTLSNLMPGQPLSPIVAATHTRGFDLFDEGGAASAGLVSVAVDGDNGPLADELGEEMDVLDSVALTAPVAPLQNVTFEIEGRPGELLSLASMLICTNDGFVGADGVALPEESATFDLAAFDSGAENNSEESEDLVDPCSALGPLALAGDPDGNVNNRTNGTIAIHPGIAGGADLNASLHGWTSVATLTIERVGDAEDPDGNASMVRNATLAGEEEAPPVATAASGNASATLAGEVLSVTGTFANLESDLEEISGTPAHVHVAPAGSNGPIVLPLDVASADNRSGNFSGSASVNDSIAQAFVDDGLYVNVHTQGHPSGEIRGQLT